MDRRVLLIDDEDDIREVAGMSLETVAGWTVLAANSGRDGIRLAVEQMPDAILLDVMMPDMDGLATFRNLREDKATSEIPIIFLTAKAQTMEQRQLREMGANGVISKPFDPMTLADEVSAILGWK